jgi:hypothetical protein
MTMRQFLALPLALAALAIGAGAPASAQGIGQLEIRAYQPIPKAKTAVQLTSDTHLSREMRRLVMIRLAKRGNEVGFSGGNVMRMDVQFRDFNFDSGPSGAPPTTGRSFDQPGSNPRPEMPSNPINPRGGSTYTGNSTLRLTLTLYSLDGGRVLWQAVSSCRTGDAQALTTGEIMIDAIFDDADKNRMGDAGCPL